MKHLLLTFALLCLIVTSVNAQTNTWTGAGANTNWNTVANWSLNAVPVAANDVVIPTGFTVDLNVATVIKSIAVQGNSTFNIANSLNFTNASSFGANTSIVFSSGSLRGGGTLTNNGIINITTSASKYLYDNTVLNNAGTMNIAGTGQLYITDGTINNQASGTIDMQTAGGNISYSGGSVHKLNNYGLIKRTTSIGVASIIAEFHNDGGTIAVQTGELTLNFGLVKLTGGIYNVSTDASLNWASTVTCEGTMTGSLNGQINWNGVVSVPVAATFNFTGSTGVHWNDGSLRSGGVLTNLGEITLLTTSNKYFYDDTTLDNEGIINIESSGNLYITDGVINNQANGVIDLKADGSNISYSGGSTHILNNYGLLKQTTTTGTCFINALLNNNDGTISVEGGILNFLTLPKYLNDGIYNVANGASLQWNSQILTSGTLTGVLSGDISWQSEVNVPTATTAIFDFSGITGVNWTNGSLRGGGTLVNLNEITLLTTTNKYFYDDTTLDNEGTINIESSGNLYITNGVLNNQLTGVIDLKADGSNISYSGGSTHILNNYGLLKQTITTATCYINALLNNNNGTISVESGILNFLSLPKYLNDGVYNVAAAASMQWNIQIVCAGTLTGVLDGDISWSSEVNVPTATTAIFDFSGITGVNWADGSLRGAGTLVNLNEITLLTTSNKYFYDDTTLDNEGTINIESSGNLYITNGIFNNQLTGVIDLKADGSNISYSGGSTHILNNYGLLKQTIPTGTCYINALLNNNDGTISIEGGILNFLSLPKYLNDGVYNVATGASLQWNIQIVPSGTLTGVLDGDITWNSEVNVPVTTTATFDFTGSTGVNWTNGSLRGGGTLVNQNEITLLTTTNKYFYDDTTLSNNGAFNFESTGQLYVTNGIINNQPTGVIDLKVDDGNISFSGGSIHVLNNAGLLKKSAGTGNTLVYTTTTNSGTIDAQSGTLNFVDGYVLNNTVDGIIKGTATLDIPTIATFINDGTFAPGGSPGTLSVLGTFDSSTSSILDVELNGLTAGTQYDVLAITGTNAIFNGSVNVTLGFAANINDEFVIATTTGTISQCDLAPTTSAVFNGMQYDFNVVCKDDNQVVLRLANIITLGIDDFEMSESDIVLYPNPVRDMLNIKNMKNLELVNGQIMDVTGKVIATFNLKDMGLTKEISLENFSSGMYFLKINGLNSSITKRIIKQ